MPCSLDATLEALGGDLPQWIHWYAVDVSMWGFIACLAFAVFGRGAVHSVGKPAGEKPAVSRTLRVR